MAKVGVYICHCGTNIAATVDVEEVARQAARSPEVTVARTYKFMCSEPGQALIQQDIKELGLDKVIVAACSPRMHESTFRGTLAGADLNPYCLEIANIREQCAWVHKDREAGTVKAAELVGAALERARLLRPLQSRKIEVEPATLVIGAGIAGIQAALDIADAGFKVYLVEREPSVGGHMAQLDKTFPTLDCSACILTPRMVDVGKHPNIELLTYSEVVDIGGYVGNFDVKVRRKPRYVDTVKCTGCGLCAEACRLKERIPSEFNLGLTKRSAIYVPFPQAVPLKYTVDPERCLMLTRGVCGKSPPCKDVCPADAIDHKQQEQIVDLRVGTIIVATGFESFDARIKPELGYGVYPNVITGLEFERLSSSTGPTGGEILIDGRKPKDVVFVHCVGSRDKSIGNEYCSRICCMYSAKQAHLVRDRLPDSRITAFYIDMRAFGKGYEQFYDRVREERVMYRRGNVAEIYRRNPNAPNAEAAGRLVVRAEDTLLGRTVEVEADLVVLAAGVVPNPSTAHIAELLKLSCSSDGFLLEAHPKLRPVDTAVGGVFLAGCCQGPKDIPDTVAQAKAAAASAMVPMLRGVVSEPTVAEVNEELCSGCGLCVESCPYGARQLHPVRPVAEVNEALCQGCGACVVFCPNKACTVRNFTVEQFAAMTEAML